MPIHSLGHSSSSSPSTLNKESTFPPRRSALNSLHPRKKRSKLWRLPVAVVLVLPAFVALVIYFCTHLVTFPSLALHTNLGTSERKHKVFDDQLARAARHARPLPGCAVGGKRAKTFLIVFMGHSGSSALLSELRSHSEIYTEIAELVDHQPLFNSSAALEETAAFFKRGIKKGKVPGFKIRPAHIVNKPKQFRALAQKYQTRIIWNYRRNLFKASVGEYANRYLNDTSAVEGLRENVTMEERCKLGAGCRFRIDNFKFLHDTIREKVKSHHAILDAVNVISGSESCVREVPYEDYLYDRENVMTDVQAFLGLRAEDTKPSRFKATRDSLCEVVENWDELCESFYGCFVWQKMLEDVRNDCYCKFSSGPTTYCSAEAAD
ncbi:hypothetical protein BWQ96_01148 [Gracilariopsis chorda]|uniref:Uncharacterized protein n=1 Tax=Gracilariopsis chorda TaxID=448386 RepID=A0A2V3J6K7_9FLOR|nr:hypothetical protein BWQ96_01148 [Gracilariopsis chorda]|eukprot:PXF49010.1 hypothetical protein BWQ96_01148 [Gracilariopsis chorda]